MIATQRTIHVNAAIESFCAVWGVTRSALLSRNRVARVAECRMALYKYFRDTTDMTLAEVGALFGKEHGAVFHGIASIQADMANAPRITALYAAAIGLSRGEDQTPIAHAALISKVAELERRVTDLEQHKR